ncbi:MAG: HAD hydrolase-like protein [Lachnospiraceae bacterium]|nr:HAD hydrolase-like protein [Lachnospiraceae bacterium]
MKKYIFFDLDGTLTDPMVGICKSAAYGLAHFGIEKDYRELTYFIGPPLMDTYRERFGFDEEQTKEAVRVFREYFVPTGIYENEIYPGILSMLEHLEKKGYYLALATSKPEPMAEIVLTHFGIRPYIRLLAGSTIDETRTKKADVLNYALETLGLTDLSEAIMVGDRNYDVIGAKQVGMECIGVTYGYGSREELEEAGAAYVVDSVEELEKVLMSL